MIPTKPKTSTSTTWPQRATVETSSLKNNNSRFEGGTSAARKRKPQTDGEALSGYDEDNGSEYKTSSSVVYQSMRIPASQLSISSGMQAREIKDVKLDVFQPTSKTYAYQATGSSIRTATPPCSPGGAKSMNGSSVRSATFHWKVVANTPPCESNVPIFQIVIPELHCVFTTEYWTRYRYSLDDIMRLLVHKHTSDLWILQHLLDDRDEWPQTAACVFASPHPFILTHPHYNVQNADDSVFQMLTTNDNHMRSWWSTQAGPYHARVGVHQSLSSHPLIPVIRKLLERRYFPSQMDTDVANTVAQRSCLLPDSHWAIHACREGPLPVLSIPHRIWSTLVVCPGRDVVKLSDSFPFPTTIHTHVLKWENAMYVVLQSLRSPDNIRKRTLDRHYDMLLCARVRLCQSLFMRVEQALQEQQQQQQQQTAIHKHSRDSFYGMSDVADEKAPQQADVMHLDEWEHMSSNNKVVWLQLDPPRLTHMIPLECLSEQCLLISDQNQEIDALCVQEGSAGTTTVSTFTTAGKPQPSKGSDSGSSSSSSSNSSVPKRVKSM